MTPEDVLTRLKGRLFDLADPGHAEPDVDWEDSDGNQYIADIDGNVRRFCAYLLEYIEELE